jgi:hypothetical protein
MSGDQGYHDTYLQLSVTWQINYVLPHPTTNLYFHAKYAKNSGFTEGEIAKMKKTYRCIVQKISTTSHQVSAK